VFWLMYLLFFIVSVGGLMVTGQLSPFARDWGISFTALSSLFIVTNICGCVARALFGWISDRIGREVTMAIAFGLGAAACLLLLTLGHWPGTIVVFAALIFLFWGAAWSVFPAICADTFGIRFATFNLGLLFTARGMASFLAPLAI
jgi:OFA family oxalate/formate antiporter-like MFS transporter